MRKATLFVLGMLAIGCSGATSDDAGASDVGALDASGHDGGGGDAGRDAAVDGGAAVDAGTDAATSNDTGIDAPAADDSGTDAATVLGDAGSDAGMDAGSDGGSDAGTDAGRDAGADGGSDAGTDAASAATDGGLVSDPGLVRCGSTSCDLTSSLCCILYTPASQTCVASSGPTCVGGDQRACDEPSDCPPGQACFVTTNAPLSTRCQASGLGARLCKNDGDCTGGVHCITQSCNTGIGHATTLSSCGGSAWCTAHP